MDTIKKITVKNFRSIYELDVDDASDINVLSGVNDIGKSNVVKALNLFFNYQVDWQTSVDLDRDTNSFHKYFSKHARKKRLISVEVTFRRPKRQYKGSLPDLFWVKRQWDRENPVEPNTTWGEEGHRANLDNWPRALTWFLKKSRFYYVPAIRDRNYLLYLLGQFSEEITESPDDELKEAGDRLTNVIQTRSSELRGILHDVTGLEFTFEFPDSMLALLRAAGLYTENNIPFQLRGDGIQGLTVPGILQYLNNQARHDFHIWGFEEPENSLEYKKAATLADQMRDTYSKNAQIFLTTHSPAFLAMENTQTSIYRVSRHWQCDERKGKVHKEYVTTIESVFVRGEFRENLLPRDLGLRHLARQFDRDNRAVDELEEKINILEEKIRLLTKPVLIVEGPNDETTLTKAWERLYEDRIQFDILVGHGVKKATPHVTRWALPDKPRMCALFDHDRTGVNAVKALAKHGFTATATGQNFSVRKHNMLAMTLPPPRKEGGPAQADNLNLTLEFFFPDNVLLDIDKRSGHKLLSKVEYVHLGKREEILDDFRETVLSQMKYRLLVDSGKSFLVNNLSTLSNEDFCDFHALFEMIVSHLLPEHEFKIKQSMVPLLT